MTNPKLKVKSGNILQLLLLWFWWWCIFQGLHTSCPLYSAATLFTSKNKYRSFSPRTHRQSHPRLIWLRQSWSVKHSQSHTIHSISASLFPSGSRCRLLMCRKASPYSSITLQNLLLWGKFTKNVKTYLFKLLIWFILIWITQLLAIMDHGVNWARTSNKMWGKLDIQDIRNNLKSWFL